MIAYLAKFLVNASPRSRKEMFVPKNRLRYLGLVLLLMMLNIFLLLVNYGSQINFYSNYDVRNAKRTRNWHDYAAIKAELARTGPGEVGSAFQIDEFRNSLYEEYGYDAVLSDQISVNRSVPDNRPESCKNMTHLAQLPKVAIIIVFYNERLSVLLRTLHGIINRTPDELLQEIILIDDCSTYSELHFPLRDYLQSKLPTERSKIRLIRLQQRAGLIVARMTGARAASKKSQILIFMDAHLEVNYNWLPPLLEPIAFNPKICTSPTLDHISFKTFEYTWFAPFRGYFDWTLHYRFFPLESHEEKSSESNRKDYILMGAATAISAEFFWNLGGFDEGMVLWGGEQFELSFKIWMCGGEIIQVPCSRMAHLYRDPNTKGNKNLYGDYDFVEKNLRRLVDVWMDEEHRQYVFNRRPAVKYTDPGDLTERLVIRDRLKCKSFSWMLDNIMPDLKEKYPSIEPNDLATGLLRSEFDSTLCMALSHNKTVVLETCPFNNEVNGNKHWTYSFRGEIRSTDGTCLQCRIWDNNLSSSFCYEVGGTQKWYYDRERQWIVQTEHNICIIANVKDRLVKLGTCDSNNLAMKWTFSYKNNEEMDRWDRKLSWSANI